MSKRYFITGIGTGVGKTVVSTVLAEALKADYYKPVQCGSLDNTDEDFVRDNLFNSRSKVHPTQYLFRLAASPHAAAKAENKTVSVKDIIIPKTNNCLIVEGAGGVLVPLNYSNEYVIHIAQANSIEVILIVDYYLGSINHSLLTLNYLITNGYKIGLLVFNGDKVESSKQAILAAARDIPFIEIDRIEVSPEGIRSKAEELAGLLEKNLFVR
jgi:dethiobiotin synthetase